MIKSNDELLYDPDEDDRDQAWVDARRRRWVQVHLFHIPPGLFCFCGHTDARVLCRYNGRNRAVASGSKPHPQQAQALPSSDAILNCPACMTTLCLDCQRWEMRSEVINRLVGGACRCWAVSLTNLTCPPESRTSWFFHRYLVSLSGRRRTLFSFWDKMEHRKPVLCWLSGG